MNYNLDLYKEFVQRKKSKQGSQYGRQSRQRAELLRAFLLLEDDQTVNLESSISILRKLSVLQRIESTDHIINIVQRKRNSGNDWNGDPRELLECRLIYAMWAVIEEEAIQMREFKEILMILVNNQLNSKIELIKELYGDKEEVEELIDSWDQLTQIKEENHHHSEKRQEISDISIIKSKNQGNFESNKENISYFNEEDINSSRLKTSNSKRGIQPHPGTLQKSFQKRQSQAKMQRNSSNGKMHARKSLSHSLSSTTSGVRAAQYFTSNNENLTPQQEQNLISRLYKHDRYKQRQEKKKQIQKERMEAELNQCSFKPILDRSRAMSKSKISGKEVKGYQKAIDRMKSGYKKNQQLKENLQYRVWKQPTQDKKIHLYTAPKFLSRVKQPQTELFQIVFTIGRHNIRIKIKESDKIGDIVKNIGRIYSLKEDNKNYIRSIIEEELNHYYEAKCRQQQEGEQLDQNDMH